jgi:uncharacterized protein YbjT (DUF2867 family)
MKDMAFLFFLTATQFEGNTRKVENKQANVVCEKALAADAKCIIYSVMSHPYEISGEKLKNVQHFDDKAEIEQYIRSLLVRSAFFAPGSFMQNFPSPLTMRVRSVEGVVRLDSYPIAAGLKCIETLPHM